MSSNSSTSILLKKCKHSSSSSSNRPEICEWLVNWKYRWDKREQKRIYFFILVCILCISIDARTIDFSQRQTMHINEEIYTYMYKRWVRDTTLTAVTQKFGMFLMISLRFSNSGFRNLLYFCSTFRISSDAFSFIESISFWHVSICSKNSDSPSANPSSAEKKKTNKHSWNNEKNKKRTTKKCESYVQPNKNLILLCNS